MYNNDLSKRPMIIVANKMDVEGAEENLIAKKLVQLARNHFIVISRMLLHSQKREERLL